MKTKKNKLFPSYDKITLTIFLIILIFLSIYLIKDMITIIIVSLLLYYFLKPLFLFFRTKIPNTSLSAIFTLLFTTLSFFLPLFFITYLIFLDIVKVILEYQNYLVNPQILDEQIKIFVEKFVGREALSSINLSDWAISVLSFIIEYVKSFFSSIPTIALNLFIILFITYYMLVNYKTIESFVKDYSFIPKEKADEIMMSIKGNLSTLFKGYFLTGIVQTLFASIGYFIFDVPNLLILIIITFILTIFPYVGPPIIWVPVSFYLIMIGRAIDGVGLLLYSFFIVSLIDNFLRPILMSDKENLSPPLVFVGIFGGLLAFGLLGIIIGPIILSTTLLLVKYVNSEVINK